MGNKTLRAVQVTLMLAALGFAGLGLAAPTQNAEDALPTASSAVAARDLCTLGGNACSDSGCASQTVCSNGLPAICQYYVNTDFQGDCACICIHQQR